LIKKDRFVERSHNKFFQMSKDFLKVCPKCGSNSINIRRRKIPKYRCQTCKNEFDNPKAKIAYTTQK
jgi:transposase-like protein